MTANGIFYNEEKSRIEFFYADPIRMWVAVEASFNNIYSLRFLENNSSNSLSKLILPVSSDLLRYFQGETVDFSIYNIDLSGYTLFQQNVLAAVRSIPEGKSITYSQLAEMIGKPGASRAVANALGKNKTSGAVTLTNSLNVSCRNINSENTLTLTIVVSPGFMYTIVESLLLVLISHSSLYIIFCTLCFIFGNYLTFDQIKRKIG
jgi:O-6-methylguanine DNA methyltransferase